MREREVHSRVYLNPFKVTRPYLTHTHTRTHTHTHTVSKKRICSQTKEKIKEYIDKYCTNVSPDFRSIQ